MNPAAINKEDLNNACKIRCIKARLLWFIPRIINISPICLRVDKATTFFKSVSKLATNPAISIVVTPIINMVRNKTLSFTIGRNRMSRNTPAVTRVDECTKADTGVGAAIAAGSQAEKGIWALLVIALITIKPKIRKSNSLKR